MAPEDCQFFVKPDNLPLVEQAWSFNTGGAGMPADRPSYYSMAINNHHFEGYRPWELRWNMIKDIIDYRGTRIVELGCCMGLVSISLSKYRDVALAVGVDAPDYLLIEHNSPHRVRAAQLLATAFEVDVRFLQVDFNKNPDYETLIGRDYDVAFCLSLLHWVEDKDRFLEYLSHADSVFFEGHDSDAVEIARFREAGFTRYVILGKVDLGRTLIHFFK